MRHDVAALLSWLRDLPAAKITGLAAAIAATTVTLKTLRGLVIEFQSLVEALIRLMDSLECLIRRSQRFRRFLHNTKTADGQGKKHVHQRYSERLSLGGHPNSSQEETAVDAVVDRVHRAY